MVEMEPGRSLLDHASLLLDLEGLLGRKVDVVSDKGIKARMRERVLREAQAIMRDDGERILDMLEAIERIQRHAEKGREAFKQDELLQTWIIHHLQIIGEAASKLSQELCGAHQEIPWPQIVAMRNVIAHEYFGIASRRSLAGR